jgi:hypothetical protein
LTISCAQHGNGDRRGLQALRALFGGDDDVGQLLGVGGRIDGRRFGGNGGCGKGRRRQHKQAPASHRLARSMEVLIMECPLYESQGGLGWA